MSIPINVQRTAAIRRAAGSIVPKPDSKKKLPKAKTGKTKVPADTTKEGKGDGPPSKPKPGMA